ncbi:MAG: hypothetical protein AABN33_14835 [Acidobacteriota bacterium]
MRIETTLNGVKQFIASLSGAGYLSAHLNLSDRPKEPKRTLTLRVEGFDTNSPSETVSLKWPALDLTSGDVVQLRLMDDGPGDPPLEKQSSAESPSNLFTSRALAEDLLQLCQEFESHLLLLLEKSQQQEPEDEHAKFKRAVGDVVAELGDRFLYPVYRRHAQLIPESLKGELL